MALIMAGGSGLRMNVVLPKQFLPLAGKPVLQYSLEAFLQAFWDIRIVLVLPADYFEAGRLIVSSLHYHFKPTLVEGGETRFHSVYNGLKVIREPSLVFVHDGVRPLLTPSLIRRCYEQALELGSAIPAIPSRDSIRLVSGSGESRALDRENLRMIQTPQVFRSEILNQAFAQPYDPRFTDEASVVEHSGVAVHLLEGEPENIKITTPLDLRLAESLLEYRSGRN